MAVLSPECEVWFYALPRDDQQRIGEDKAQEVFDSLKYFEGVSWDDIRGKKLDRLNEARTEKRVAHFGKKSHTEEEVASFKAMERAFNVLGRLSNELNPKTAAMVAQDN